MAHNGDMAAEHGAGRLGARRQLWQRAAWVAIAVVTVVLLGYGFIAPGGGSRAAPEVGRPAPNVTLVDLAGKRVALSSLHGHVVILNFWFAACAPCRQEMPLLEGVYRANQSRGVVVVGIDTIDDAGTAQAFLASLGIDYPIWRDVDGQAIQAYRVVGTPTTFVIDRQGVVRARYIGAVSDAGALTGAIARLLAR